jgi:hypothetical protein
MASGMPPVKYNLIQLQGGLDLVTPTLSLPPGVARESVNFEVSITGGYSRIPGYERFDGRPNPSDANYNLLTVASATTLAVGNTITNLAATVSGVIIAISDNLVVYTKAVGAFLAADAVYVGGVLKTTVVSLGGTVSADSSQAAEYLALAADNYRADIGAVPGSGPIRGVVFLHTTQEVFAWRNNAGGTAMAIYKASTSGWTAVSLGFEMPFNTGTLELVDGNTITGQTSGAVGTIKRVVLQSGSWTGGTAAGYLVFASITGTFSASENLRISTTTYARAVSAQAAITLNPDGQLDFVIENFGSATRIYGADTVNYGFEFDGTTYVPIRTGMTTDTPTHVAVHKQHLFFSFGSSVQFSGIGAPYEWSPIVGAGEIALNNVVTAFLVQPGDQSTGAMAIYSDDNTFVLYGSSSANFALVSYNVGTGAKPFTCQNVNVSYSFDDRGVINMATTLNFGNFDSAALTLNLRPFVQQRRNLAVASGVNREKGQYRVFFSDGYGLYVTLANGKYMGSMPVQFPNAVTCMAEGEKPDGAETAFFGSTNGYVYRLDAGTSFDGEEISASMTLVFNAVGSPRLLKRFRRGSLEITGSGYAEFAFNYDLAYSSTYIGQESEASYSSNLVASFWDSAVWDAFVWDGRTLAPSEVEIKGTAENIAIRVASISAIYQPFTINSIILHYTPRRGLR